MTKPHIHTHTHTTHWWAVGFFWQQLGRLIFPKKIKKGG
jgi:hypothetical protein